MSSAFRSTTLEECDLPSEDEPIGAVLTEAEEIDKFIEVTRPIMKMREEIDGNA